MKLLRGNALIFHHLCRASSELNDVFSFHVFYMLTAKFVSVITMSVAYVYSFIHQKVFLEDYSLMIPYFLVTDWARILVLLTASDMPIHQVILWANRFNNFIQLIWNKSFGLTFFINQVRLLREQVTAISCTGSCQTMAEKIAVHFFFGVAKKNERALIFVVL